MSCGWTVGAGVADCFPDSLITVDFSAFVRDG